MTTGYTPRPLTESIQEWRDELNREYDGDQYNEPFSVALERLNEAVAAREAFSAAHLHPSLEGGLRSDAAYLEGLEMEVLHERSNMDLWYRQMEMTLNLLRMHDRDWYNAWVDAHPDTGLSHV
jgi:hypothetical protein